MKKRWKWYQWGDEKAGYVRTWYADADGRIIHGRNIPIYTAFHRNYEFECPFA